MSAQVSSGINVVTWRDEMKNLPEQGLSEPEVKELESFLLDFFPLMWDNTSLVQHHVDTGNHAPLIVCHSLGERQCTWLSNKVLLVN